MVDTCSYDWGFLSSEEFSDESFSDGSDGDDFEEATSSSLRVHYTTEAMDSLVPGLDPSDYGQMPATFYSNSQKIASTTIATDVVEENRSDQGTQIHDKLNGKAIRDPILPRNKYDGVDSDNGVDSDDETDEENLEDDESEGDMPQVVGDVEIDMEEEAEEFLEFSRHTLGISEKHWGEILRDRKERGGTIPIIRTKHWIYIYSISIRSENCEEDNVVGYARYST